ncbi:MAG: MBL fold metallo-hydrolase [Proteobacteria bacterium]|nr:MBL fold metallo-hydrolase [Pseudomonadota bacterium]
MEIHRLTVSPVFIVNAYVLACPDTNEAIIIDAGDEADRIMEIIDGKQLDLKYMINTHAHVDHLSAVAEIKRRTKVPFYIHEKEKPILDSFPQMAAMFGGKTGDPPDVDGYIDPDKTYTFGECSFKILEVPGHTPGSVCFLFGEHVFVGDTLFAGGIGRTDIPGGSHETLLDSVRTQLFPLDGDTVVHPGHGPVTTIGQEKASNPFFPENHGRLNGF